jgi:hypothetical protein
MVRVAIEAIRSRTIVDTSIDSRPATIVPRSVSSVSEGSVIRAARELRRCAARVPQRRADRRTRPAVQTVLITPSLTLRVSIDSRPGIFKLVRRRRRDVAGLIWTVADPWMVRPYPAGHVTEI